MSTKVTALASPGHPRPKDLADAMGSSVDTVFRMIRAGIAETVQYPSGQRVKLPWAHRFLEDGLTPEEKAQLTDYNRRQRSRR